MKKNVLILNGPNINLLKREDIYGGFSIPKLEAECNNKFPLHNIEHYQSNCEGDLVSRIHKIIGYDGLVINAGAYTHSSIALYDAIKAVGVPTVEVHITNIYQREEFRHRSYISLVAQNVICGFGLQGYLYAVDYLLNNSSV